MVHMANLRPTAILWSLFIPLLLHAQAQTDSTYSEPLGLPKGSRVLIIHVDDAGMSLESNEGAIAALTRGAATSVSVMMPCPQVPVWVPSIVLPIS
jgi:chitin disaccharide deacetylase